MAGVAEALEAVRARLASALVEAGRPADSARLVAVSKQQPEAKIREAYAAGQRDFGENYAQELRDKARALADLTDLRWHFIGHLQANKAKYVAPVAALVHAVDGVAIARELARRAGGGGTPEHPIAGRRLPCLVEINVGGEAQKSGVLPSAALELCLELRQVEGLELRGLMCLPPEGRPARPFFAELRQLAEDLGGKLGQPLPELSMGMSSDFEDAVREGSTIVRVGTAIFGDRRSAP
jgi:pyridoxal phosphate enzyme (YggS family)